MRRAGDVVLDAFLDLLRGPVRLYLRIFYGFRVRGLDHIPRSGPYVLSPNHQTHYDGLLVGLAIRSPIYALVSGDYYKKPVLGTLLRILRCVPTHGSRDREAFPRILERLESGQVVAIFPEGARTRDGGLGRLKPGAARAALSAGADILPVSILGGFEAWPRHRLLPRLYRPIVVDYHPLIRCRKTDLRDLRRRVDEVTAELEAVLGRPVEAWRRLQRRRGRQGRER